MLSADSFFVLLEGGGDYTCMYVRQDIRLISRVEIDRRKCVCLGVSLGSSLQQKAESITQSVSSRLCGLIKRQQTQQHVWTRESHDIYIYRVPFFCDSAGLSVLNMKLQSTVMLKVTNQVHLTLVKVQNTETTNQTKK